MDPTYVFLMQPYKADHSEALRNCIFDELTKCDCIVRRIFLCLCILISGIGISGCTAQKGFDRGAITKSMYSAQVITDDEIKRVLELKPQIKFPFKLGVYYADSYYGWYRNKKWEKDEKDPAWLDQLKADGIVSEVIPITSLTIQRDDDKESLLKAVRLAAARHNADAVEVLRRMRNIKG